MIIKSKSILYKTDQAWKFRFMLVSCLICFVVVVGDFILYSDSQWQFHFIITIGLSVFFLGQIVAYTIRCPNCKSRWWWNEVRTQSGNRAFDNLVSKEICPDCGLNNAHFI